MSTLDLGKPVTGPVRLHESWRVVKDNPADVGEHFALLVVDGSRRAVAARGGEDVGVSTRERENGERWNEVGPGLAVLGFVSLTSHTGSLGHARRC